MANGRRRAVVAQVGLLCAATRVVERDALHRAFAFLHLGTTVVAHKDCLSCHVTSDLLRVVSHIHDHSVDNAVEE
jgi:hypothetical protein